MMADAQQGPAAAPLSMRLSVPAAGRFREIAPALAGKFAKAVGFSREEADRVGQEVERAAARIAAQAGGNEVASLDLELTQVDARRVEISLRCAGVSPAVIRMESAG